MNLFWEQTNQIQEKGSRWSVEKTIEIAETIYSIKVRNPATDGYEEHSLLLTDEQRELATLFELPL